MLAFVGQVTFLGLMGACLLTTLVAIFTPSEFLKFIRKFSFFRMAFIHEGGWPGHGECHKFRHVHLLQFGHGHLFKRWFFQYKISKKKIQKFKKKSTVDTIVSICLIFALLLEICALGWAAASLMACFVQKLRKFLFYPLPGMAGGVALFLFLSILLFALKQQGEIEFGLFLLKNNKKKFSDLNARVSQGAVIGYSYYVCCISLLFALGSLAAGVWTAFFLEHDF